MKTFPNVTLTAIISDTGGAALSVGYGDCATAILSEPGDINGDSDLNVLDVVILVNGILGTVDLTDSQFASADLNGDGDLNVLDVVILVNMILG